MWTLGDTLLMLCPFCCEFGLTLIIIVDLRIVFLILTFLKVGWPPPSFFFLHISSLSDHFTQYQLGEGGLVWEEAFCYSVTLVVLGVLQEQGPSAVAARLLKYAGICPANLPWNVKASHHSWNPSNGAQHHNFLSGCSRVVTVVQQMQFLPRK